MFQAGGTQLISDLRWSDREYSHYRCDSKRHDQSPFRFHISCSSPPRSCVQPIIPVFLFHLTIFFRPIFIMLHLHLLIFPLLFLDKVLNKDVLLHFSLTLRLVSSPSQKPHSSSIISIPPLSLYPFPFLSSCFLLSSPYCIPHCNSCHVSILSISPILSPSLLSISFPSLPLPQIWFDSHSLPGLNHQDLLEGPNHRPVSPQRGFCLLTVETNDLHALCLWSVPRHLEAVEVITVICLTRRATAHSHSLPLHLLLTVKAALF